MGFKYEKWLSRFKRRMADKRAADNGRDWRRDPYGDPR